ncbi:hypothetical protein ILYODFUR_030008 [Ilyodon furcidens]|uniref:Uncharacterized protein n=1 Tax=Ilyodon furcidens TaxID=33524 RepID=A0ABV0U1N4_9TELE
MNAGSSNSKTLLNFVACDQCDCRNFVIFGPVLYFNFIPLESLRALGLGWGRRSCQQRVGSLMSQLQPQFICTLDILICIHHNTSHYHRHTHQHHGEGAVLGGHRMLPSESESESALLPSSCIQTRNLTPVHFALLFCFCIT